MPSQPSVSVTNKLILARHLFRIAEDNLKSKRDIALFAAVNLMQDAVEAFLLAAAEHVNASIAQNTNFDVYFTKINERLQPNKLSFQARLTALNKARVNAKHYGLKPDRNELEQFTVTCREFFDETCSLLFEHQFWSISLLDLLQAGESKQLLANATALFEQGEYLSCLIECRKAIFVLFEARYDIAEFRDDVSGGLSLFSYAPYYARNREYIQRVVKEPFDYIVLDHQKLESTLLTEGIDPQVFWNIRRITPEVYRSGPSNAPMVLTDEKWIVKRDLSKEARADGDHAAYALDQTIDIALRVEERRRLVRYIGSDNFFIRLKRDGVNVYEKADRSSAVSRVTEAGMREVSVDSSTPGLRDDGTYWYVTHRVRAGAGGSGPSAFYYGYIHEDDVDWSKTEPDKPVEE
jgi:hypothetical protein